MIAIRPSEARGQAAFGWLNSRHSFSFGSYYDPDHLEFSALRVINDDQVAPGAGFPTHGHRDMEIISHVLSGEMVHEDSAGNATRLPAGEFQLMSAGSGIHHSEFNASQTDPLHFLQIWIQPSSRGSKPRYQQKSFGQSAGLTLVASAGGDDGSLVLKQDAKLYQLMLGVDDSALLFAVPERNYYVHLISGELLVNDVLMRSGDGARINGTRQLNFSAQTARVKALVFDLPPV